MVDIKVFHNQTNVALKIKFPYFKDVNEYKIVYKTMLKTGFKQNKRDNTFYKSYNCPEYTKDRFDVDLQVVKTIANCGATIRRYKLVETEVVS